MTGVSSTILRAIFATVFATVGFLLGRELFSHLIALHVANEQWLVALTFAVPVLGAVAGIFMAPVAQAIFEVELGQMEQALEDLTPAQLVGGATGLIVGLLIAWLIRNVLAEFGAFAENAGGYVALGFSILLSIFAAYLGARVGAKQRIGPLAQMDGVTTTVPKIIDTSIIVDGRIVEIIQAGFLEGSLVLPRFVLRELQLIADSADAQKRMRGRRGLEVLSKLQELTTLTIDERDYDDAGGQVDAKLVRLARERGGKLVTNDYNLGRVATVEGVTVLNLNDLAAAVKPVVLPGEDLHVSLIRDGKESGQGVGYLEDGTMIVVENGRRLIGEDVDVQVTSVLQTVAGRMIFAK
ncbi:MAG TPA: PIN domain-containing protein, partial [Candidatus Acidoferrales bacterium]|nr:PIN domain-containing protein [Candidatus Acidoferrales bacterium]